MLFVIATKKTLKQLFFLPKQFIFIVMQAKLRCNEVPALYLSGPPHH
jgi:hypothetical protein